MGKIEGGGGIGRPGRWRVQGSGEATTSLPVPSSLTLLAFVPLMRFPSSVPAVVRSGACLAKRDGGVMMWRLTVAIVSWAFGVWVATLCWAWWYASGWELLGPYLMLVLVASCSALLLGVDVVAVLIDCAMERCPPAWELPCGGGRRAGRV